MKNQRNIIITGPTRLGKGDLACALGNKACRDGFTVAYRRVSRLFDKLAQARAEGTYPQVLRRLAKAQVLVLDDSGLEVLGPTQHRQRPGALTTTDNCSVVQRSPCSGIGDRHGPEQVIDMGRNTHSLWEIYDLGKKDGNREVVIDGKQVTRSPENAAKYRDLVNVRGDGAVGKGSDFAPIRNPRTDTDPQQLAVLLGGLPQELIRVMQGRIRSVQRSAASRQA